MRKSQETMAGRIDEHERRACVEPLDPEAPAWTGWAVATVVAKNYLAMARVLCRSFLDRHPGATAHVLLADDRQGAIDPAAECFELLDARDLGVPWFDDFAFKYDVLELSTALKPFFLAWLLERHGVRNLVYLDPDVQVFSTFHEVRAALEETELVLTPHLLSPLPSDGRLPADHDILMAGAYNLGFVAMRPSPSVKSLLAWWKERLYDGAFADLSQGLFTDQKWIDLAPGFCRGTTILGHPGYNAAYWNLHERRPLVRTPDGYSVAGVPLRFFHFSGYDRSNLEGVSRHQNRFSLSDLDAAHADLFGGYAKALDGEGWRETRGLEYAFGRFRNGAKVPRLVRREYARMGEARRRFGNPFDTAGEEALFSYLVAPAVGGSAVPRFAYEILSLRPDLREVFPDLEGRDLRAFLEWLVGHAEQDHGYGELFLAPVRLELLARFGSAELHRGSGEMLEGGLPGAAWKKQVARAIGFGRFGRWRRRYWDLLHELRRRGRSEPGPKAPLAVAQFGVNLFGYFDTESGVGEVGRSLAKMLQQAGIPHVLVNVDQGHLRRGDRTFAHFSRSRPYAIDLLAVNADQAPHVVARFDLRRGPGRLRIGYWFWELSRFPDKYAAAMDLFDELWVASTFCQESIARAGRVPVLKVPPAFAPQPGLPAARRDLGLDPGEIVFLLVFDAASGVRRKNPAGVLRAFRNAFQGHGGVRLVLKTTGLSERDRRGLERLARGMPVRIWNGYVSRAEILGLIGAADVYVSLHRSEGLGLTVLEALLAGKPVVVTDYGGVRDFLDVPGVHRVPCREVPLKRDFGPYPRGSVWAEPDLEEAARAMKAAYEEARQGESPARREAAAILTARYSIDATSREMSDRLRLLRRDARMTG